MKRNRDTESSLELLLDTMCNTFGGVMFIAIALVVVLSMTTQVKNAMSENKPEITQERLEELQKKLEELKRRNSMQAELLDTLKNDPRREMLKDLIRLEAQIKDLEIQEMELSASTTKQSEENRVLKEQLREQRKEIRELEQQIRQETAKNSKIEELILKMQDELKKMTAGHITFKTLAPSKKIPYFLIVHQNRIWRIGPEKINEDPHGDVTFTMNNGSVICRINKNAPGTPLLKDGRISPEAEALLAAIPGDRFPDFSLHSDSAEDFFTFREVLKKRNIPHGINVNFLQNKVFVYQYTTEQVDHETY